MHIIVLGAGYAGLTAVLQLQKKIKKKDVKITLINKHMYHYQTTWLHRCAVGVYSEAYARVDLEPLLKQNVVTLKKEVVKAIHPHQKEVHTDEDVYNYDFLVVALGAEINTGEIPGLDQYAHSIVTLARANRLRNRFITVMNDYKKSQQSEPLHIVVGGGGFTGVELLGELVDQLPKMLAMHQIDTNKLKLTLIEKESTVLPEFNLELGEYALARLEEAAVDIKLQTVIKEIKRRTIKIEQGGIVEEIPHDLFIWTAGVGRHSLLQTNDFLNSDQSMALTNELTVQDHPEIYIIGDAIQEMEVTHQGNVLPNADIAIQKGKFVAEGIIAQMKGSNTHRVFSFKPYGSRIASIGQRDAIGLLWNKKKVVGALAARIKRLTDHFIVFQMGGFSFWYRVFIGASKKNKV